MTTDANKPTLRLISVEQDSSKKAWRVVFELWKGGQTFEVIVSPDIADVDVVRGARSALHEQLKRLAEATRPAS